MNFAIYKLYLSKVIKIKEKPASGHCVSPVTPATGEARAGESLVSRDLRPAWPTQQEPISKIKQIQTL